MTCPNCMQTTPGDHRHCSQAHRFGKRTGTKGLAIAPTARRHFITISKTCGSLHLDMKTSRVRFVVIGVLRTPAKNDRRAQKLEPSWPRKQHRS
jgi:hypothetical protein